MLSTGHAGQLDYCMKFAMYLKNKLLLLLHKATTINYHLMKKLKSFNEEVKMATDVIEEQLLFELHKDQKFSSFKT